MAIFNDFRVKNGLVVATTATIQSRVNATSTQTGALIVAGGAGVGRDLWVEGTVYASGIALTNFNTSSLVLTAINLNGGSAGSIAMQSGAGVTTFIAPGTAGQLLQSNGTTSTFVNTGSLAVGFANRANNLAGGAAGSLVYQSGNNATTTLPIATTSGWVLRSTGSIPNWVPPSSLSGGTAAQVETSARTNNAGHFLVFVDSNNESATAETLYTTSTVIINPTTGRLGLGITPTSTLDVAGDVEITGITTVTNTTNASSTITGALVVAGGVGIGRDLYVGYTTSTRSTFNGKIGINTATVASRYTVQVTPVEDNSNSIGLAVIGASSDYTNGIEFGRSATRAGGIYWVDSENLVRITTYSHSFPLSFGNNWLYANTSSNIGIGTTVTNSKLTVNGTVGISGITTVTNTTNSTNTTSGALQIVGGAGIGLDLYVGGTVYSAGTALSNFNTSSVVLRAVNVSGGAAGSLLYQSAADTTTSLPIATTSGWVLRSTGSIPNWIPPSGLSAGTAAQIETTARTNNANHFITFVDSNNASATGETLYTTSSVVINPTTGRLGINVTPTSTLDVGGDVKISGITTVTNNTNASSTVTGALQVVGGVGIGGNLYVGGEIVAPKLTIQLTTVTTTNVTTDDVITTYNTTNATNTTSGALQVAGGVGIGRDLWVGGTVYSNGIAISNFNTASLVSSAISIAAGTAGSIAMQSGPGITTFIAPGTAGQLLQSQGTTATFVNTGSLTVGFANRSNNLAGGVAGSIPLQTGADATSYIAPGVAGQLLQSNGTTATFVNTSTLHIGIATLADTIETTARTNNANHFLTFVDSNNASATGEILYTTSSLVINPTTGRLGINITPTSTLDVGGDVEITGITTVTNNTNASSTVTGALQVVGGVGIGRDLWVGGAINAGSINAGASAVVTYVTATQISLGTYVGPKFQGYSEAVTAVPASSATTILNLGLSNIFDVTLTANTSFRFINTATSGSAQPATVILRQGTGGNFTATFIGARYSDGVVPVLSTGAGEVDVLSFFTVDGGNFWFGTFAMANVS